MKIAIMTWFSYLNYGTFLQAAAISRFLELNGHQAEVIDYLPDNKYVSPRENILIIILRKIRMKYEIYWGGNYPYIDVISGRQFTLAIEKLLNLTRTCKSDSDLLCVQSSYDVIVCGSDQIWSPNCFDPHYFLDFVTDNTKMIAYAPSFGASKIFDKEIAGRMHPLIDRFHYLSVRENAGADIIRDLTGKIAKTVADPTLLLGRDEWAEYLNLSNRKSEPYLLVYFLGFNSRHWTAVEKIRKQMNLPIRIIPVTKKDTKRREAALNDVGPKEFVELIANASYICTDSYHGILFSIIFQKQFTCFKRFKGNNQKNQNSRVHSILKNTGLSGRMYGGQKKNLLEEPIDYQNVEEELGQFRESSAEFLLNSIDEICKNHRKEQGRK